MITSEFNVPHPSISARLTALVVDDEKDICFLLYSLLKQKNIPTRLAGSLAEAEKLIEIQTPAVIFLDNHLPDGLGVDNIARLKKEHPGIYIIMITAHDSPADKEKAQSAGVDHFIGKPFNKNSILETLTKLQFPGGVE
jgi:two-component system, OmpR family, response regulator